MPVTINGTTGIEPLIQNGNNISAVNSLGFRNRIINGDMRIDQRNNGASVTPTDTAYTVDRWQSRLAQVSKYSVQQNAGAITPPTGFTNYLGVTSSSAYSILTGDYFAQVQTIEGFNGADFGWGTANAQSVTLSFWVRSSLTGTFGCSFRNSAGNRSYPFTYIISAVNTWEQKTVTVSGDITGTWPTNNTAGISLFFGLGVGATLSGTPGSWSAGNFLSATGAVSVVGTSGATLYITGVQLEAGTVATPFERRDYGRELMMCQRYYQKSFQQTTAPADNQTGQIESGLFAYDTASGWSQFTQFIVTMRTSPTVAFYQANARGATAGQWATYDGTTWTSVTTSAVSGAGLSQNGFTFVGSRSGAFTGRSAYLVSGHYTAAAEL